MRKLLKVTAVLNIIFGVHYIALAIIALFGSGIGAVVGLATFSLKTLGGTIGLIFLLALCIILAYLYGYGGICTLKGNKRTALINAGIAAMIALVSLFISLISKKIPTSFLDVLYVIVPIIHAFLIIKTED